MAHKIQRQGKAHEHAQVEAILSGARSFDAFTRGEAELALELRLAAEAREMLGKRVISPGRLRTLARRLSEVAKEGSGVLVIGDGGSVDIIPKSRLKTAGTFDHIPAGADIRGLADGLSNSAGERQPGLSLVFSPAGERWTADSIAVHQVFRGLLERRGFDLTFEPDCRQMRHAIMDSMSSYLYDGSDMLLSLPTIPVDARVLCDVVSAMEKWPEISREHALRGSPLVKSREHGSSLLIRDWTKLHSGAFKDRAALAETALCLMVHEATGRPVVGLVATTGNMGASLAKTFWHATHAPDGTPLYEAGGMPALGVELYGTSFNPKKREMMQAYGATLREGYATFNKAFDAAKNAMWTAPGDGKVPVWCGDTSIRIAASTVLAYELALDIVKQKGKTRIVADYLEGGNQGHEGRRVLNEIVGNLSAVIQVGNGVNYAGIARGFCEMKEAGIIDSLPELIPVQPKNAVDIAAVHYIAASRESARNLRKVECALPDHGVTIADGVDCPFPVAGHIVYEHYRDMSVKVSDSDIRAARRRLQEVEGISCEPAGAVGYAALVEGSLLSKLQSRGRIVVMFITGSRKD